MKNILLFTILLFSFSFLSATTYYISPNGNNNNSGTSSSPWKTLYYACSKAKTSGDIIHVNAGTYVETAQCQLAAGVSIEGAGVTSVIVSQVSALNTFTILLSSASEGSNGNQHISNIKMDGSNLLAFGAIKVFRRSNVSVYNCTFVNFKYYGVHFAAGAEPPSVYAKGNKFYNNTVTNCSGYYSEGKFAVGVDGQDGILIYDNNLNQTSRSAGNNGYLIKGVEGYNKGMKIYRNTLTLAPYSPGTFGFAIELWDCRGGVEIYDNTITGTIDIGGYNTRKETYSYAVYIHDNKIGPNTLSIYEGTKGVILEGNIADVIVSKNYIKNVANGIYFSQVGSGRTVRNVNIFTNIIDNIGVADGGSDSKGWGINWTEEQYHNNIVDNINIWNNTIIGHVGARSNMWGIKLPNIGTATNISVRNNIVRSFNFAAVYGYGHTGSEKINYLSIENNIFYLNGNNNLPRYNGLTPTNNTTRNNLAVNPLFVSNNDYHLTTASPAVSNGIVNASLTTDYEGNTLHSPPCIGAISCMSSGTTTPAPVYQSSSVENSSANVVELTYNLTLANIVPSVSSFNVTVNGSSRTINSVSISGTKVRLTLQTAVVNGNVVTVSYTKPASNPLQSTSGGQAANLTAQSVRNNVSGTALNLVSAVVENATPTKLDLNFNQSLANVVPATSAFQVFVNGSQRNLVSVAISGSKVQITLLTAIVPGNVITVSYIKPSSNQVQAASGIQAPAFTSQAVTNNVSSASSATTPVFVNAVVENASPKVLTMTFSGNLSSILPAMSQFQVFVNGNWRNLVSVSVSGNKVTINLLTAIASGNVVTVSYTKPTTNPLQGTTGLQVNSFNPQSVTNNVGILSNTAPAFLNAVVENASPKVLTINFSSALSSVLPAMSQFQVHVNGNWRNLVSVSISGSKVTVNLLTALVYTDVVTITYTQPSVNPLQGTSGLLVAGFEYKPVTNNVENSSNLLKGSLTDEGVIASESVDNKVSLYPNPAIDNFNISFSVKVDETVNIMIFDMTGKMVQKEVFESASTLKVPVALKSGVYVVKIESANQTISTKKLIIN